MADTLTSTQISDIRLTIGDSDSNDEILSDALIQRLYDRAVGNYALTIIYALEMLAGQLRVQIRTGSAYAGTGGSNDQLFTHITEHLLPLWNERYDKYGNTLYANIDTSPVDPSTLTGIGRLDIDLDADEDEVYELALW